MKANFVKVIISSTFILLSISSAVIAQDSTASAKIDTVLMYQKQSLDQQEQIYNEIVRYKEPLADKTYGIEFNPAYFLTGAANSSLILSGTISFFAINRKAEIACPFLLQTVEEDSDEAEFTKFNQDLIYRRFLGQHQNGFYLEAGLRYTHLRGEEYTSYWYSYDDPSTSNIINIDKAGMLFGIGYRYFSHSGIYWGTSLAYGSYLTADERKISGAIIADTKTILDFEILKFGYAF